jgi:D-alanine-D-alanine ligase
MNKNESKKIVRKNNYLTPDWFAIDKNDEKITSETIKSIDFPCIVKPNAQGSTFGLSIVNDNNELIDAIKLAGEYDDTLLIEKYIIGREITVGILDHKALPIVEIIPDHQLYDYECKYSPGMSQYLCPTDIESSKEKQIKEDSEKIFKLLGCNGYGRLDFLLDKNGRYFFLELNTLPGMTSTSLLPIAADKSGKSFTDLIGIIIRLSLQ